MPDALIIFRHGQTDYNKARRFQGQGDIPLNEMGRQQAVRTGEIVSNCLRRFFHISQLQIEALTSDLLRASDTAREVAARIEANLGLGIFFREEKRLREWDCGDFTGHTIEEFEAKHPGAPNEFYAAFEKDPLYARYPGGECKHDLKKRLHFLTNPLRGEDFFAERQRLGQGEEITKNAKNLMVISGHGGIIHVLLEELQCPKSKEDQIIGNGDVLILVPNVLQRQWSILRHYRVGDNCAAAITKKEL